MPSRQTAMNCTLAGFDQRAWTGKGPRGNGLAQVYMGAPRRYDLEGQTSDWFRPHEDIATEGCPGGWIRSPFVASVLRYMRRPTEGGGRVPNRLLDLCDDELVIESVALLEAYQDASFAEYLESLRED